MEFLLPAALGRAHGNCGSEQLREVRKFNLVPEVGDIFPFYRYVGEKTLPLIPYKSWRR